MLGLIWAGSAATIIAAVGSVASLITAFVALRGVKQVHTVVNSKSDAQSARIEQLAHALQESGVAIPESPKPGSN